MSLSSTVPRDLEESHNRSLEVGDAGRLVQDETSVVLLRDGFVVKSIPPSQEVMTNELLDNIHITPEYMEFTDASEGLTSRRRITIRNVGYKPAYIKIRQPNSIAFQVKPMKGRVMLNPGLSVSAVVTYSFRRPSLLRAMIPIEINEKILHYRVICTLAYEGISITPKSIDFGTIDIGYSSGLKIIEINNEGGKSTRFSIDLGKNDLEITVKPLRGIVRPHKQVKLRIELIGMNEGVFFSEFWIKSYPNIRVPLKVTVIVPRLVVYHPNTTGDFTLLDFPPTVVNTRKLDTFVLRNVSSQVASYVVLGEIGNDVKCIRDIDREQHPVYDAFEVHPIQGRMGPFEGIIFEVGFTPTTKLTRWREKLKQQQLKRRIDQESSENDFMAFLRIVRVHVTETEDILRIDPTKDVLADDDVPQKQLVYAIMDSQSSSSASSSTSDSTQDTVRLCLYGEVEVAKLTFEPDILYFGDLCVGQTSQRVVRVSNSLKFASIISRCVPNAAAHCLPERVKLKPQGSAEILVKVKGKDNIRSPFKLYFDAIADSYVSTLERRKTTVKVGSYPVDCVVNIMLKQRITHLSSNLKGPQTSLQTYRCPPVKQQIDKPSTDSVVLDYPEALSPAEAAFKAKHRLYWANYIRSTFGRKLAKEGTDDTEIIRNIIRTPAWRLKKVSELVQCDSIPLEKPLSSNEKAAILIPLSPLQIYNVHIYPIMFTFGMVAPRTHNYRQLIVENKNDFPVMIRLLSLSCRSINFPQGNLMILSAGTIVSRLIEFRAESVGRFNGYIDYVINDSHSFELSVTADVVQKQLSVDKREIVFGTEYDKEEMYQPTGMIIQIRNKLDAKTCFKWEVSNTCGFFVEPMYGAVRANGTLYAYVFYKPDISPANDNEILMKFESGSFITVRLRGPTHIPKASFINDVIDVAEIPLNLPTKVIGVIRSFEVTELVYEVDSSSLVDGCEVHPVRGNIPPRGVAILHIFLKFDACFRFNTMVRVTVQKSVELSLKIVGRVSFPRLKLVPQSIDARRISADAHQIYPITATNFGTTALKLNFFLEEYTEFRVSLLPSRTDPNIGNEGFTISPGCSQNFYLHFEPVDLASYAFYLPIVINDLLGPPTMGNVKSIRPLEYLKEQQEYYENLSGFLIDTVPLKFATISIDCTVAGRVIFFNKFTFHFDVSTGDVQHELIVENRECIASRSIRIEASKFFADDCPFSIRCCDGVEPTITETAIELNLNAGDRTVFLLKFHPKDRRTFSLEAPIFVRDQLEDKGFNKLCLTGDYPASSIEVENPEIYFSPMPLRMRKEETIILKVRHFESSAMLVAKISHPERCCGIFLQDTLNVHFPNGNVVPATKYTEVEVKVTFESSLPVSFRLTIKFADEHGIAVCPVTIHAIADNNLLTTHATVRKVVSDFRRSGNVEHRVSYVSISSVSGSEDEDYDDNLSPQRKPRQTFGADPSVHSYSVKHSRASISKPLHGILKPTKDEYTTMENEVTECSDVNPTHNETEYVEMLTDEIEYADERPDSERLQYPYFPIGGRKDEYDTHMHRTLKAAEQWLYLGPFKFGFYPDIPNGITASMSNICTKKRSHPSDIKRKNHKYGWSLVDVLESLLGSQIYDILGKPEPLSENGPERAEYVVRLYDRILHFLLDHGACLAHVSPQFLLSYHEYVLLNEQGSPARKRRSHEEHASNEIMSPLLFESRSKQSWLDVTLQIYKCFVLTRVSETRLRKWFTSPSVPNSRRSTMNRESLASTSSRVSNIPKQSDMYDKVIRYIIKSRTGAESSYDHSSEESLLLSWLYYHYEQERVQDWMMDRRLILNPNNSKDVAQSRVIDNFDEDLADSLVLIAVTAAYCPFLIEEYFSNLYICPKTFEEVLHNAICVVTAWRKIRLGFVISPLEIVRPNCVQMLMLVTHLFEVLPTYIPRSKIKFSCPLTESVTRQISFTNPTSHSVGYLMVFVGNDNGFFTIVNPQSVLRLNGHDSVLVKIRFHARKIRKIKAYLLFCGSVVGPYFGRNQTFVLEGQADHLRIAQDFLITSKLYHEVEKTLNIEVPYNGTTEYEIWLSEEEPTKPATLKMAKWSDLCVRKIPRRLFLNQKSITIADGSREGHLSITVACIAPVNRSFWLIFQSKQGDFIIQINSQWQTSLTDRLVVEWEGDTGECVCSDIQGDLNAECPFNVRVQIPVRNAQLWSCVAHMFQKTLDSKERLFWVKYLDTYIGLRLIRWLMGDSTDNTAQEFTHIFDTTVTYDVTITDKTSPVLAPKTFSIRDVRPSSKTAAMTVHISPSASQLYETTLSLTSVNEKELRLYTVSFLRR